MEVARTISKRSPDEKYKVGAIIVTSDNTQMLAVGYNGDHKGGTNRRESFETGESGFIHAEINALIKCDYNIHKEKHMYVTLSPCKICSKAIINANIKKVFYEEEYCDKSGIELLKSAGIIVQNINDLSDSY
jgi:dCMP deaminase